MQISITAPTKLRHTVILPASKSISNRVLIINALSHGKNTPQNISDCDDTAVMLKALCPPDKQQSTNERLIDIQAAGTAMRFLSAYLAVCPGTTQITGTARMKQRPIGILVNALRTLGAQVEYLENEGFPPLRIAGGQHAGGQLQLAGNVSSQYISALLMIGPVLQNGLELELTGDIISRPYIDLTLHLMTAFGAQAGWTDERHIRVLPTPYRKDQPFLVENDWSAASYWYQIMALSSDPQAEIILPGLFRNSCQGDAAVLNMFEPLGVHTTFLRDKDGTETARLTKTKRTAQRMDYDFINQPDLAQTFVVTCIMLGIPFRFTGLQSLKIKETDRIAALIRETAKMGVCLNEDRDAGLCWDGSRTVTQAHTAIDTYEDHRMAMAFAPCSLVLPEIRINNPQVVSKSYPHYWQHLSEAGFKIEEK